MSGITIPVSYGGPNSYLLFTLFIDVILICFYTFAFINKFPKFICFLIYFYENIK